MKKYFFVIKNSIQQRIAYRFNTLAMLFSGLIKFGVLFYFWSSVYKQGNQVGSYSLEEIVTYYFLVAVIALIVSPDDVAWRIGDEIRLGNITGLLLKPINYLWYKFFQSLGSLFFVLAIYIPLATLLFFPLRGIVVIPVSPETLAFSFVAIILAFIVDFLIFFLIGISTFWFGMVKGLNFSMYSVMMFFSGGIVPLDLFPEKILRLADFLPFQYLFFTPIGLLSGRIVPEIKLLLLPAIWAVSLFVLSTFILRSGIKKYEGYGA